MEISWTNFITTLDIHETQIRENSNGIVCGDIDYAPIYPIVAFDSRSMDYPIIIGLILVSHKFFELKGEYPIGPMGFFYDTCKLEGLPNCILEYVAYVYSMEEGNWKTISELMLYHNRAVVVDEALFETGERIGWVNAINNSLCREIDGHQYWANEPIID